MRKKSKYSKEFLDYLSTINAKRAKTVIDHILKHDQITSEELKNQYGYNHPPRAVRDVREYGIPIITFRVADSEGRSIAAYKFGEFKKENVNKLAGRTLLSKKLKDELIDKFGSKCFIYNEAAEPQELQIDHRVPYEVGGESSEESKAEDFMLLSASANRAKSWSCEHCENWRGDKDPKICRSCYWAFPENYSHVAGKQIRRVDLLWQGDEISEYEKLKRESEGGDVEIQQLIKSILSKTIK